MSRDESADWPLVLLVDDERDLIEELAEGLALYPVTVELAGDGFEAFASVERLTPDLVLVDQNMPGLTGTSLIQNIRSLPHGQHITFLMMSAYLTDAEEAHAARLDVRHILQKPFDLDDAIDRVVSELRLGERGSGDVAQPNANLEARVRRLEEQMGVLMRKLSQSEEGREDQHRGGEV